MPPPESLFGTPAVPFHPLCLLPLPADVNIRSVITKESSGLVTIRSILLAQVTKEDRKALFRCQVNYNLMGVNKTIESKSFQINVYCKDVLGRARVGVGEQSSHPKDLWCHWRTCGGTLVA